MRYAQKTSRLALALLATTMLTQPVPARADRNDALEDEFRVNVTTALDQRLPSVAMDADGDFVVVWQGYSTASSSYDIFARRYDAGGFALDANDVLVNTTSAGSQGSPAVAMDAFGDFVVVWSGYNTASSSLDIFARRYDAAGNALDANDVLVNTVTSGGQDLPAVAMDADGDFVVAWNGNGPGDTYGVFARRFNAAGNALDAQEVLVNTYVTSTQKYPAVAREANGDFVVAWQSDGQDDTTDPLSNGVYFQRYNAAGTKRGSESLANTTTTSEQEFPAVAMDTDGDFVVAWAGYGVSNPAGGVFAQAFDAAGAKVGIEFSVNTTTNTVPQSNPAVAMDADGDFVVTWDSYGQDGSLEGIYARWFPAAQAVIGGGTTSEFPVNSYTTNNQRFSRVAMDADGDYVVAWESFSQDGSLHGVFAQRFDGVESIEADFDGDGNADVLWRKTSNGSTDLWLMDGTTRGSKGSIGNPGTAWQIAGTDDFNGDGKADVAWRKTSGANAGKVEVWLMDGRNRLDKQPIGNPGTAWTIEALRDTNGDGLADIVWRKTSGSNSGKTEVWLMSVFTRLGSGTAGNAPAGWQSQ